MKPVSPQTGAKEVVIAKDQKEYIPYPAALYTIEDHGRARLVVVSRWHLSPEERQKIADGEDIFLGLMTDGSPVQPIFIDVGGALWAQPGQTKYVCPGCLAEFDSMLLCRAHILDKNCDMDAATHQALSLL